MTTRPNRFSAFLLLLPVAASALLVTALFLKASGSSDTAAFNGSYLVDSKDITVTDDAVTVQHATCGCIRSKQVTLSNLDDNASVLSVQLIGPDGAEKSSWQAPFLPGEIRSFRLPPREEGKLIFRLAGSQAEPPADTKLN